jgi:hypothetical protein
MFCGPPIRRGRAARIAGGEALTPDAAESVRVFAVLARDYCNIIERVGSMSRFEFVAEISLRLAGLYAAGLQLPPPVPCRVPPDPPESFEWQSIETAIAALMGEQNLYWEFFDPFIDEVVTTTLSDDLSDIYRDLSRGLALYHRESIRATGCAGCEWGVSFAIHWGAHLVDAQRVLHRIIADQLQGWT